MQWVKLACRRSSATSDDDDSDGGGSVGWWPWRWQQLLWWLVLMMTIAMMTMTPMVVEVLDGDSGKDRQWSVLITRLMTCTSIPIVQRSANTNIKVECSTVLLVTKEVHCTTNQIAHTCDLHNVLKSLRTECAKWQNASRKFGSGVESSSVSWSASFWGNDLRRWILALVHESFSKVFINPTVCRVKWDFWVGQLRSDQRWASSLFRNNHRNNHYYPNTDFKYVRIRILFGLP